MRTRAPAAAPNGAEAAEQIGIRVIHRDTGKPATDAAVEADPRARILLGVVGQDSVPEHVDDREIVVVLPQNCGAYRDISRRPLARNLAGESDMVNTNLNTR